MHINGRAYELIHENKDGWNPEAFRERFSEVLERYDYVIGDWGYNQLRLKGFFRDNHPKATRDSAFSSMLDYINEYCNFGCAYFVLQRHPGVKRQGEDGSELDSETDNAELFEGIEDAYELSIQASDVIQGEETGQEQARTTPRIVREHQRREYHPKHLRKDSPKDVEKEPVKENRKPFNKDKDRDRDGGRQQSAIQQEERPNNGERERSGRHRKPHFTAPKAPVAAAAEIQTHSKQNQGNRQKDSGPKA
ncbi:YutD family protein [Paenibacillus sepulcri]